jgi:hypothetical protein
LFPLGLLHALYVLMGDHSQGPRCFPEQEVRLALQLHHLPQLVTGDDLLVNQELTEKLEPRTSPLRGKKVPAPPGDPLPCPRRLQEV